ncbi:MAG: nitroreductase family protein [Paramuribaculum sp.]|nr:nitroreductase family protein [Paramuribaculum sp.]
MKTSYFLILVLAVALVVLGVKCLDGNRQASTGGTDTITMNNDFYSGILTRASVRKYTSQEVTPGQVDSLLKAAMSAPTAVNKQPWQFVVVNERALLDSIASKFPNIHMAASAPLAVVVCGDLSLALEGEGEAYWIQDCSAATENMLLAAHSMGLGAVWCGIYPIADRVKALSDMLSLPENIIPLCVVPIGYPEGEVHPKDKFTSGKVHYNKF